MSSLHYGKMDGYSVNSLRPDEHKHGYAGDCLHTYLPGDEIYSRLLLHMLQLRRLQEL